MRQCNCGGGREFCGGLLPLSAITPPVISLLPTKQPFMLHPKERNHSTAVSISSFLSTQNPQNQRLWWFNPASNASQIFELSPYVGWARITSTTTDFCSHGGLEPFSVWLKANLSLLSLFSLLCWFIFPLFALFSCTVSSLWYYVSKFCFHIRSFFFLVMANFHMALSAFVTGRKQAPDTFFFFFTVFCSRADWARPQAGIGFSDCADFFKKKKNQIYYAAVLSQHGTYILRLSTARIY